MLPRVGLPFLVTREVLLEQAGFKPIEHVRKAVTRTVEALDAVAPARRTVTSFPDGSVQEKLEHGGAPDHRIRLDAADRVAEWANVKKPPDSPTLPTTIVILWDTSAKEVPPVSVRMALSSGASSGSRAFPSSSVIEAGERPPSA